MIYLIDKIKQKNDGDFFLVDAADIECADGTSLEAKLEELSTGSGTEAATDEEVEEALNDIFGASE